jgi:hypothetical protein
VLLLLLLLLLLLQNENILSLRQTECLRGCQQHAQHAAVSNSAHIHLPCCALLLLLLLLAAAAGCRVLWCT